MQTIGRKREQGVMLLEALIGILIFSLGILSMVAMQGLAIGYTADAKYRSDASFLANEIIATMWMDSPNLANYAYPGGSAAPLAAWVTRASTILPQADAAIVVDAATGSVDVTLRWTPPNSAETRSYRTLSVVSGP
jgi:type IV pilus assembly protein PilV